MHVVSLINVLEMYEALIDGLYGLGFYTWSGYFIYVAFFVVFIAIVAIFFVSKLPSISAYFVVQALLLLMVAIENVQYNYFTFLGFLIMLLPLAVLVKFLWKKIALYFESYWKTEDFVLMLPSMVFCFLVGYTIAFQSKPAGQRVLGSPDVDLPIIGINYHYDAYMPWALFLTVGGLVLWVLYRFYFRLQHS